MTTNYTAARTPNSVIADLTDEQVDALLTERVTVSCKCKTCKVNAEKLGLSLPLRAECSAMTLRACKGKAHGIVYLAHDPSPIAAAARERARTYPITEA